MRKTDLIAQQLTAFEKSRSTEELKKAIELGENIDSTELVPMGTYTRREVFSAWLQILAALDGAIDPHFDPKELPHTNVTPPPDNGVTFPPGVDPKALRDPKARAEYEAALQKNRDYADFYNQQTRLQRLEARASGIVAPFVKQHYLWEPGDLQELNEVFALVPVTAHRKEWILQQVPKKE